MSSKINVVGLGIQGARQITSQGIEVMKRSKKTYYLGPDIDSSVNQLHEMGVEFENILHLYNDGAVDSDIYQTVFNFLIEKASIEGEICLIVPGHPRFGVSVVAMLENNSEGVEVEIFPGVSCVDTLVNDLKRDPIEFGSVLIDANRLLLYEVPLSSALDIYIFHVCSIGTSSVHLSDAAKDNKITLLKDHLSRFYPPDQKLYLVCSSMNEANSFEKKVYTLDEMEEMLSDLHFGTTLYIPGQRPTQLNKSFLESLLHSQSKPDTREAVC